MKVVWTQNSINCLQEIDEYISKEAPLAADRLINSILDRGDSLANFPESGRVVPEFNHPLRREVFEGNYRIIYSINGEVIEIETVWAMPRVLSD